MTHMLKDFTARRQNFLDAGCDLGPRLTAASAVCGLLTPSGKNLRPNLPVTAVILNPQTEEQQGSTLKTCCSSLFVSWLN